MTVSSIVLFSYDLDEVDRLASAVARSYFGKTLSYDERRDAARFGILAAILEATSDPGRGALITAGGAAVRRASEAELHARGGHSHSHGTAPGYARYWRGAHTLTAPWEDGVIERIALWQIWATLRYEHQETLWALAQTGDHRGAAEWCGISYANYSLRLSEGRKAFRRRWFYPDADPGPWGRDRRKDPNAQHTHTVMQSRARTARRAAA